MPAEISRIMAGRASTMPAATAYEFLAPGGGVTRLGYAELYRRACRMAGRIIRRSDARRPVLLLLPPGPDYVVALYACFLAGAPAVPAYPPDPRRPAASSVRLRHMLRDLGPATLLTDPATLAGWPPGLDCPESLLLPATGEADAETELPVTAADDVAVIQYTSGSTAEPKGVVVRHRNLTHNIRAIASYMGVDSRSRALVWLPPYHDMGLVGGILTPLFVGFPVRLMSPFEFLKRPMSWLRQISEFGATVSGGPNFAYDLCVRHHRKTGEHGDLDLSGWTVAFNGAEPVLGPTMAAFTREFAPYGFSGDAFFPCYGLAEATLLVAGGHWTGADDTAGNRVSCGRPLPDQRVVVVDPDDGRPVPDGAEGEIWVSGPSVTDGYWNSRAAPPFALLDGRSYLRTGDFGRLRDGELLVTGTVADVLVHAGTNHHAIDVERAAVLGGAELRPVAAAFMVDGERSRETVVVVETGSAHARDQLARRVRERVLVATGLVVDTVVVGEPGTVPRTSSGKVQRQLCRKRFVADVYRNMIAGR